MPEPTIEELEAHLEAETREQADPRARVDALCQLAWALRSHEGARAYALASEARTLAIEHGYTLGQARAARTMAMAVRDAEGMRAVFPLAMEARELFDAAGDASGRAASRDFLSSLHEFVGDLSGGLELALEALSIARELGDPVREGYALSSVGGILAASGETTAAIERLKEALTLFERVQDHGGIGTIASRLSKVLRSAGDNAEAQHFARLCLEAAQRGPDLYARLTAYDALASLEDEAGNLDEAERLYRAALDAAPEGAGRTVMGGEARISLARLFSKQGRHEEAERGLRAFLEQIADDPMLVVTETRARETMAELCERRGALAEAIAHLRKAQTLRERIAAQEARSKLVQIESRAAMDAARKDAEIHRLRYVELHGMQSKLVEAEKMALLGKLAAGTAHELNSPLAVLRSNTELAAKATDRLLASLEEASELGPQARKLATVLGACRKSSGEAMERIAAVTASFGRFAQLDQAERRDFDVREGLDAALSLLEPTLPQGVVLTRDFEHVPPLQGWPRELNQAFMTVLQNGIQAIEHAGTVLARTHVDGAHVLVSIRDSGRGMHPEQVDNLFDVAWAADGTRTKMRLGLSAALATVQRHGGSIEVESEPGHGTTVTFRFPAR